MANNKSIFEVDIDDSKAKAYFALVEKYQQRLGTLPGLWQKVAAAEQPIVAALAAQTQLLQKVQTGEKAVADEAGRSERSWKGISGYVSSTADNLSRITTSLLKWTGIGGALGAIVGAVSLDRIADAVSATRRSAGGYGIGYGQQQAFGLDLGRFVDPGAVLGASRNAIFDVTNPAFTALRAAGINPQGGNAADVSAQLLQRLPGIFAGTPQGLVGPKARSLGLDQFFSLDDIVRYLGASPGERSQQLSRFKEDSQNLDLQAKVTRQWQDFSSGLSRAELGIENTFVKGLAPLTGPLEKLAGSVDKAIATFLNGADKWLEPLGKGIEHLATYLVGDDFKTDLDNFKKSASELAADAGKVASAFKWVASWLPGGTPDAPPTAAGPGDTGVRLPGSDSNIRLDGAVGAVFNRAKGIYNNFQNARAFYGALDQTAGGNQSLRDLLGLVGGLENAPHDPNAVSKTGALGLYQIEPDTARTYGRDPSRLTDAQYNTDSAAIILRDLSRRYHGDLDKILTAYHSGRGAVEQPGKFPLGPEGRGYLEKAHNTQGYQKVVVEVHEATGSSAIVSGSQIGLGGAP